MIENNQPINAEIGVAREMIEAGAAALLANRDLLEWHWVDVAAEEIVVKDFCPMSAVRQLEHDHA